MCRLVEFYKNKILSFSEYFLNALFMEESDVREAVAKTFGYEGNIWIYAAEWQLQ